MKDKHTGRTSLLSFTGSAKHLLDYLANVELVERYERIVGIDTPITRRAISLMAQSKLNLRASTIIKRWNSQ